MAHIVVSDLSALVLNSPRCPHHVFVSSSRCVSACRR